jgi:hypothetical protein
MIARIAQRYGGGRRCVHSLIRRSEIVRDHGSEPGCVDFYPLILKKTPSLSTTTQSVFSASARATPSLHQSSGSRKSSPTPARTLIPPMTPERLASVPLADDERPCDRVPAPPSTYTRDWVAFAFRRRAPASTVASPQFNSGRRVVPEALEANIKKSSTGDSFSVIRRGCLTSQPSIQIMRASTAKQVRRYREHSFQRSSHAHHHKNTNNAANRHRLMRPLPSLFVAGEHSGIAMKSGPLDHAAVKIRRPRTLIGRLSNHSQTAREKSSYSFHAVTSRRS